MTEESAQNGEGLFFHHFVKDNASVIFDVGCQANSIFTQFEGQVHYFNPKREILSKLTKSKTRNERSVFNRFGLASTDGAILDFYTEYNSFIDHFQSNDTFPTDKVTPYPVRSGKSYMKEHHIEKVDLLKISVNGSEFDVLKGFEDMLQDHVHMIQFRYSKSFYDANVKLHQIIQYLASFGFYNFSYIVPSGLKDVTDLSDFYEPSTYIVGLNENFKH